MLAAQRERTYARRASVVHGTREASLDLMREMAISVAGEIVDANWEGGSAEVLVTKLRQFFPALELQPADLASISTRDEAEMRARSAVADAMAAKVSELDGLRDGAKLPTSPRATRMEHSHAVHTSPSVHC